MSGFVCPHCGKNVPIFGKGGGKGMAHQMGVPFLGEIPLDPQMVEMGDTGKLDALAEMSDLEVNKVYEEIVNRIVNT
jgi:hypothetical protein